MKLILLKVNAVLVEKASKCNSTVTKKSKGKFFRKFLIFYAGIYSTLHKMALIAK